MSVGLLSGSPEWRAVVAVTGGINRMCGGESESQLFRGDLHAFAEQLHLSQVDNRTGVTSKLVHLADSHRH